MKLFLDIETIGTEDAGVIAEIAAGISPPGNISKPETIAAWESDKKPALVAEAVARTSFDGGLGRVIVFGYAEDRGVPTTITAADEPHLLASIVEALPYAYEVVGHNVTWDVRFLWQRFVVNGINPPKWLASAVRAKPWEIDDTMTLWNSDRDKRISLDKLCRVLGIKSPKAGGMDGSQVWDYYRAGKLQEIAEYCAADVEAMRKCYRRMVA